MPRILPSSPVFSPSHPDPALSSVLPCRFAVFFFHRSHLHCAPLRRRGLRPFFSLSFLFFFLPSLFPPFLVLFRFVPPPLSHRSRLCSSYPFLSLRLLSSHFSSRSRRSMVAPNDARRGRARSREGAGLWRALLPCAHGLPPRPPAQPSRDVDAVTRRPIHTPARRLFAPRRAAPRSLVRPRMRGRFLVRLETSSRRLCLVYPALSPLAPSPLLRSHTADASLSVIPFAKWRRSSRAVPSLPTGRQPSQNESVTRCSPPLDRSSAREREAQNGLRVAARRPTDGSAAFFSANARAASGAACARHLPVGRASHRPARSCPRAAIATDVALPPSRKGAIAAAGATRPDLPPSSPPSPHAPPPGSPFA